MWQKNTLLLPIAIGMVQVLAQAAFKSVLFLCWFLLAVNSLQSVATAITFFL